MLKILYGVWVTATQFTANKGAPSVLGDWKRARNVHACACVGITQGFGFRVGGFRTLGLGFRVISGLGIRDLWFEFRD